MSHRSKSLSTTQSCFKYLPNQVQYLGQDDPLRSECQPYCCIFAWEVPWTEKPVRLQPMDCKELDMIERLTLSLSNLIWSMLWSWERGHCHPYFTDEMLKLGDWFLIFVPRLRRPRQDARVLRAASDILVLALFLFATLF